MLEHRCDLYLLGPVEARLTARLHLEHMGLPMSVIVNPITHTLERLEGTTPVGCRLDMRPPRQGDAYLYVTIDTLPDGRTGHSIEAVSQAGTRVGSWQLDGLLSFFGGGYHLAYRDLQPLDNPCPAFLCPISDGGACPDHVADLS